MNNSENNNLSFYTPQFLLNYSVLNNYMFKSSQNNYSIGKITIASYAAILIKVSRKKVKCHAN